MIFISNGFQDKGVTQQDIQFGKDELRCFNGFQSLSSLLSDVDSVGTW